MDMKHEHGLQYDLENLFQRNASRRQALKLIAGVSVAPMVLMGCGNGDGSTTLTSSTTSTADTTTSSTTTSSSSACTVIPTETGGPYPGDGTNSVNGRIVNALVLSGIVRSDIKPSLTTTNTATGIPLTIKLKLVNTNSSCASLAGYVVYLWHCTSDGLYSLYSAGVTSDSFLRGVQVADADGYVTFKTIFPGCYSGRMPHVHFEIYPNLVQATSAVNAIKTSQFGFPVATLNEAYTNAAYSKSVTNLAQISYATDMVFSDGVSNQIATVTGSMSAGYVSTLTVGLAI
ncbi:hypothetical protein [Aquirhabdus sp.]|uniref:dioxygenase family protein n=1 Tax=Aquirhabdus sp. TaxID=2824160 RepID=UPI00396C7BC0